MMDALKKALEQKKQKALEIKIVIDGNGVNVQPQEEELGESPVVDDKEEIEMEQDPGAQDVIEVEPTEEELLEERLAKAPRTQGRKDMTLNERVRGKMRGRLKELKK